MTSFGTSGSTVEAVVLSAEVTMVVSFTAV